VKNVYGFHKPQHGLPEGLFPLSKVNQLVDESSVKISSVLWMHSRGIIRYE